MKTVIKDVITFILKFWSIIKEWLLQTIEKYKFKNVLMVLIALVLYFGFSGKFWTFWGHAVLFTWLGMNIESLLAVYRELKANNNW